MSCTPGRTLREARMLRAIAHAVFRDHSQDQRCSGCLELAGFATMRGYAGNAEYPTCGEALGPQAAFEPIGGARATDRHQELDTDDWPALRTRDQEHVRDCAICFREIKAKELNSWIENR